MNTKKVKNLLLGLMLSVSFVTISMPKAEAGLISNLRNAAANLFRTTANVTKVVLNPVANTGVYVIKNTAKVMGSTLQLRPIQTVMEGGEWVLARTTNTVFAGLGLVVDYTVDGLQLGANTLRFVATNTHLDQPIKVTYEATKYVVKTGLNGVQRVVTSTPIKTTVDILMDATEYTAQAVYEGAELAVNLGKDTFLVVVGVPVLITEEAIDTIRY